MDKKQLEDVIEPSIMESFNEIQKQIDPLYKAKNSLNILAVAGQYEYIRSASSVGEIARKAFQQSGLDFSSFENQSTMIRCADLGFQDTAALQDMFFEARKGFSTYNSTLSTKDRVIQSMGRTDSYKDMMASFSQFRKSIEPLRDSLNTVGKALSGSEFANLVRELQTSRVIPESTISEYAGIIKQFESLRNLESFKAISRLKNFPKDSIWQQNHSEVPEITESFIVEAKKIDASISDELSTVDDFNQLSEDRRTILINLYRDYYYPLILNSLVIIMYLQDFLEQKLDLTNNTFIFVEKSKEKLSYISNVYRPNPSAIMDNIVAGGALMLLAKILGFS